MSTPYHKDYRFFMKYSVEELIIYDPILGNHPSRPFRDIHIRLPHCFFVQFYTFLGLSRKFIGVQCCII